MVESVAKTGGHLGAGLGVVDLTVALQYVFNTPEDKIVWDTGHQAYPHKIITGRRDLLYNIRKKGGISGFLKRSESEYDAFGAGHASTSISAALGLAVARDLQGKSNKVVAVIGDGAMTGGMAYEAMNNCGFQKRDIIVVLNDNNVSISENVWAISDYFSEIFASPMMQRVRENIKSFSDKNKTFGDRFKKIAVRVEDGIKAVITPGMLFEALGFKYFGPTNAHNLPKLIKMLRLIKDIKGPILLHINSEKGKGYAPAEQNKSMFHGIGKFDVETGETIKDASSEREIPQYQTVFGHAALSLFKMNPKLVAITAAMGDGTGLDVVQKEYPQRVFDVGIAEEHAVTFAAGLAAEGIVPICAIYSSFLQRAFDQIAHDCSLQNLHVIFAIDRAGLVGADGPTHHGVLDIAFLRAIQNIVIMAPKDEQELRDMLYSGIYSYTEGPVVIRYPRGKACGVPIGPMNLLPLGKGEIIKKGADIAILAFGKMVQNSLKAADILEKQGISAEVINARFVKPLDEALIKDICERHKYIITLEDAQVMGGFGSAVLECICNNGWNKNINIKVHGIPDKYIDHGTQEELFDELNLSPRGLAEECAKFIGK